VATQEHIRTHAGTDVQAAVAFAAAQGRPALVKTTGHQMVGPAHDAVVITTHRMNGVVIDVAGRTARVGAGALWSQVVAAAAKDGLAPLNGSNPTVGVSGYTLGGGLSPTLGRSHGYAADHVRSLDVVTADGELRQVDAASEPELFWALRGGKGNFGVVTALEFDVFPVPRIYGGGLYFPGERMADVLRAWTAWHPNTPETMVSSFAVLRLPPLPELPAPLRGVFAVTLRFAYNGTAEDGERMIAPLRAIAPPIMDTVRDMPYREVASIHDEPTEPLPYYERGVMLRDFPKSAQDKLIELVGPMGVEVGPAEPRLKESIATLLDGMAPWQGDRRLVNNLAPDEAADAVAIYGPERYARLAAVKRAYDPTNMFRINHNVGP
jgi:FAD/FMN-containing dehydrogenase